MGERTLQPGQRGCRFLPRINDGVSWVGGGSFRKRSPVFYEQKPPARAGNISGARGARAPGVGRHLRLVLWVSDSTMEHSLSGLAVNTVRDFANASLWQITNAI